MVDVHGWTQSAHVLIVLIKSRPFVTVGSYLRNSRYKTFCSQFSLWYSSDRYVSLRQDLLPLSVCVCVCGCMCEYLKVS